MAVCMVSYQCLISVSMSAGVVRWMGCELVVSLISFLKFSQLALAQFALGGAAVRMGEVEMVS